LEEEAAELASKLEEGLRDRRQTQTESALKELERAVEELSNPGSERKEWLDEIERIDDEIDPQILSQREDLQKRYDRASAEIARCLRERTEGERDRQYNREAMEAADEAWEMYKEKRDDWSDKAKETAEKWNPFSSSALELGSAKEKKMKLIANVIGGWESHRLLPSVNRYLSSVRSEIFEDLDREGRRIFTEKMIEVPLKKEAAEESPVEG
jgi:chromosome segregation ATPase